MATHLHRLVFLAGCLLVHCGGGSDEYEPPRLPPPPAPPPAPTVEAAPLPEPYSLAAPDVSAPLESQATPPLPPPPPGSAGSAPPPPNASAAVAPAPPPAQQSPLVYSYPAGQWVYLSGQGWVWVPSGAAATETDGVPYVYLYTPAYGWTWYVSPWGWGPYRYGLWVRHPWHPAGLHGYWVAHPRVVVRLGGRGHFRR